MIITKQLQNRATGIDKATWQQALFWEILGTRTRSVMKLRIGDRSFKDWTALSAPVSDFFKHCKNAQEAIKMPIWSWQLIK